MADKNFVVKHGLEVDNNLIFADQGTNKVGIGTTITNNTLQVGGGIGATSLTITGVSTFNNIVINGTVSAGNSLGSAGQILISTGVGVTWVNSSTRAVDTQTASVGASIFNTSYTVGLLDVFINGVKYISHGSSDQHGVD